jgi:hypothetical protein
MSAKPKLHAVAIALSAALGSASVVDGAAADETLTLVERATSDAVTDLGAQGDSAGDILTFANEIFDKDNANKVGSDNGFCARTVAGKACASGRRRWPTARSPSKARSTTRPIPSSRSPVAPANMPRPAARWRCTPATTRVPNTISSTR